MVLFQVITVGRWSTRGRGSRPERCEVQLMGGVPFIDRRGRDLASFWDFRRPMACTFERWSTGSSRDVGR
jgi:hypothetical protein